MAINSHAKELTIITLSGDTVSITLLDKNQTINQISKFNGEKDDSLRKKWTARTYKLNNEKLLLEFYDGSSALIENKIDLEKLKNFRFVKNYIDQLKKNVSYKIEIDKSKALRLKELSQTIHLKQYKPESPKYLDYKIYQLRSGQILYFESTPKNEYAAVYENVKTLASEKTDIEVQEYGFEDDEYFMKELSNGNTFFDYEPNEHLIYPEYIEAVLATHQLVLKESEVFVSKFWGSLYQSENGYWVLIDEINQPNGAGSEMQILTIRIYESLQAVRDAQARYEKYQERGFHSEHMYQQISDNYGTEYPNKVDSLIKLLPSLLNFDKEQLSIDDQGIKIIDEAIHWNHTNYELFDSWFPSVFAYYGEYYRRSKNKGKWEVKLEERSNVFIPQITLEDGSSAFDTREFYKSLMEWPIPLKIAGDYEGRIKLIRQRMNNGH